MNSVEIFQKNFQSLLDSRGLSLRDAAEKLDMSAATMSRYLNGLRTPELGYLIKIALYFDVSLDWLVGLSESRKTHYSNEASALYDKYTSAPPADRAIINAVLSRYEVNNADISD